jgi:hypothetical protein
MSSYLIWIDIERIIDFYEADNDSKMKEERITDAV